MMRDRAKLLLWYSQIPTGVTATVELPMDKFNVIKRNSNNKCPNDHLKINGINEPASKFAEDAGDEDNGVKLCGTLAQSYTYNHLAGKVLKFEFKATGSGAAKGFRARICLSP